jgi:hypothetical protein
MVDVELQFYWFGATVSVVNNSTASGMTDYKLVDVSQLLLEFYYLRKILGLNDLFSGRVN